MVESQISSTSRPDPSILTTAALNREIEAVQTAQHRDMVGLKDLLVSRLDGMDKASELKEREAKLVAASIERSVAHLKELLEAIINERAASIQVQFEERDVRTKRDAEQVKLAVDAALQAAKEAVSEQNKSFEKSIDKSEGATTKQIESLGSKMATATAGLEGQIADIKDRLVRIESLGVGRMEGAAHSRESSADVRAYILLAVALVSIAIAIAGYLSGQ